MFECAYNWQENNSVKIAQKINSHVITHDRFKDFFFL